MSFVAAQARFASQAARERQQLHNTRIQPYTGEPDYITPDSNPVDVALTPPRTVRELADNGPVTVTLAQLRVMKTCRWAPAVGVEFVVLATRKRWRCRTASGADSAVSAEIVCEVVQL